MKKYRWNFLSAFCATHAICRRLEISGVAIVAYCFICFAIPPANASDLKDTAPQNFASAGDAVVALVDAARKEDVSGLLSILGEDTREWISSGDPALDRLSLEQFVGGYDQKYRLEPENDDRAILVIGDDGFPFPFPVVRSGDGWAFDPEQGKEELLDRRVGRNELNTIEVLLAIVDAQFEYSQYDRDGDGIEEYAAKFGSSSGEQDGLYWPTSDGEPLSPLGPLVAEATAKGYGKKELGGEISAYHGYLFKPLSRQGADAPGGAREYVVQGHQIGGFAVLAYPTIYANSGIMTFMINQDGAVYQNDLGPETRERVALIESFNPGKEWSRVGK